MPEAFSDFGTHFVTAPANGGPDGGLDVARTTAVARYEFLNGADDNSVGRTTPPGVDRAYGPETGIEQEDRYTVSRTDSDGKSCVIGNQPVAFSPAISKAVGQEYDGRMNLPEGDAGSRIRVPRAKCVFLPNELIPGLAAVTTFRINNKGFVQQTAPAGLGFVFSKAWVRYQSRVRRSPSSKVNRGL